MGYILMLVFCILLSASSAHAVVPHKSWKNALKPGGVAEAPITLARNGKALYGILLPSSPSTQEDKAATDLSLWLGQMTGAGFSIYKETAYNAPSKSVISIGRTRLLLMSGATQPDRKLADEGYTITTKDGNLFLVGGATRGIINAVYALLEEDLGCRWYSRFSQTIPHRSTLSLRVVKRSYSPVMEIRDPYYWEAFDGTWSLRNRTNSPNAPVPNEWGGHQAYALFVHTFSTLVPADKYFGEHPEYFSEHNGHRDPGQLCVTNPEVVKIAADTAKRVLRDNPSAKIISVSQNDSVPCCSCAKCKAVSDAEGGASGPLLAFVNAVADEVGKEFPKVKISTLAYLDTFMPPKTIKPHSNVVIQLCTDSHAWSYPFRKVEETELFQTAMKGWAVIGANIDVWDYTCNFSHYAAPAPNWQVVSDSIRFFVKHNAKGVMLQGNYQTPGTADGYMRCWVWGKQLWNPKLDTLSLMKDFVYGYYGSAADPVWQYELMMWNLWEKEHQGKLKTPAGGIRYNMSLFDKDFLATAYGYFKRAEDMAADPETRQRVEELEQQILYADLDQLAQNGKPVDSADFKTKLDKFERVARRMNMTHMREGSADFESWMARMRQLAL